MAFPQESYDHERPGAVFRAALELLPEDRREEFRKRYEAAEYHQGVMSRYNAEQAKVGWIQYPSPGQGGS